MTTSTKQLQGMRILVTGAAGFIGRRTVAALVAAGAEVVALLRTGHARREMEALGATARVQSLSDGDGLLSAMAGADAICHLAYDVRAGGDENLAAFQRVQEAAEKTGLSRFVHLSSVVVYDGWPDCDLDETSPMDAPGGGGYRQAKIAMERALMAGGMKAAILQPTIVYGPGSAIWTERFLDCVQAGGAIVLPEPEGVCNAVFVDDVAAAIVAALILPDLGQERFLISGPAPVTWSALFHGYAEIAGSGSIRLEPVTALRDRLGPKDAGDGGGAPSMAARVSATLRKVLGTTRFEALVRRARGALTRPGDFYPDHHLIDEFSGTGRCSIAHAKERLGYRPAFDLATGLDAIRKSRAV